MGDQTRGPAGPAPSHLRLHKNAKHTNLDWSSKIAKQEKKRKVDVAQNETENPPANKRHKLPREESPEVIIIEDDPLPAPSQEAVNLVGRRKGNRETRKRHIKEEMGDVQKILENLKDQVTDWTLRVQQSETSFEMLRAKIGDPLVTTWQEDMRGMIMKEMDPLVKRIEKLEDSRVDDHHLCDPSKGIFKSPTTRLLDKVSTHQSTLDGKSQKFSSTTYKKQGQAETSTSKQLHPPDIEGAGVQLDLLSNFGISSAETFWRPPALSNAGLKKLLQKVDFRKVEHLRALNTLDDCSILRDCVLFCNSQGGGPFQIDYILRTGTTSTYIQDPIATTRDQETRFNDRGLGGLRVHQLNISYSSEDPNEERRFKEWKRENAPPKYIYDMGQLFLRRRGRDRCELYPSQYNLVADITKPRKPVWLVMRPEYIPIVRIQHNKERTSEIPFSRLLNGVGIAKIADSLGELNFCQPPFCKESVLVYLKAEKLVASTGFEALLTLQFPTPNIDHMEAKVMAGWEGFYTP